MSLRIFMIGLGAVALLGGGYYAGRVSERRHTMTSASFRQELPLQNSTLGGRTFQRYGTYSTAGKIIRIWPAAPASHPPIFKRIMIVSDAEPRDVRSGAYEVTESRGVYCVIRGAQPVKFSVLNIVDQNPLDDLQVDDVVALSGDFGEVHYENGASTSAPDLGKFIGTVNQVVRIK